MSRKKALGLMFLIGLFVILPGGFLGSWIAPTIAVDILSLNESEGWAWLVIVLCVCLGVSPGVWLIEKLKRMAVIE